jgi:CheY-like chemotaxis protein
VLVVEDDPAVARVLGVMLQRDGHHVALAGSLDEARRVLARIRPAVILLDVQLPDGSGLELLDHLDRAPEPVDIPVIVLSAVANAERNGHSRVVEWLMKPFSAPDLLRVVRQAAAGAGGA